MSDIVLPIAVLGMLLLLVSQICRLILHALLFRTIRKAIELNSPNAPLLIAKLHPPRPWPEPLIGWMLLACGLGLMLAAWFENDASSGDTLGVAAVTAMVGLGVLVYAWWVDRAAPRA